MADQAERGQILLQRHGAALLLFARQWSSNRNDAEDAMQAGFVKFRKSRKQPRDETAHLYACVRSAAMDLGRSERRQNVHKPLAPSGDEWSFDLTADRRERSVMIEAALNQLPADQREVFVMRI